MRLSDLVAGLPVEAASLGGAGWDVQIEGVCHDSRRCVPGDLFVAMTGATFDGREFAQEAVRRGAAAVLSTPPGVEPIAVPVLVTPEPRSVLAPLAARAYRHPERELLLVGVTGTNGKSTVTTLASLILEAAGHPSGLLGTLGYTFRGQRFDGERTTPEASDLFRCLRAMRRAGAEAVAMEVSSHALVQGRVSGVLYDVAVFTNLTRDHFDFHHDFENYFAAKRRLFDQLKESGRAVVNLADPYGSRLRDELPKSISFGRGGDVEVLEADLEATGSSGRVKTPRGVLEFESPLIGRYNLENILAAIAVGEALELEPDAVVRGLASARPLSGRLEPVPTGRPFTAFIDFAHTPAALEAALGALRELVSAEIILVFGCGGDRDPGKRPLMGRAAGELADLPILTSDNPRSEDPNRIIAAVEGGLRQSGNWDYRVVPDRREAIREAVALAAERPGSAVLVAGKGHEQMQIIGEKRLPFSDRREVEEALLGLAEEAPNGGPEGG